MMGGKLRCIGERSVCMMRVGGMGLAGGRRDGFEQAGRCRDDTNKERIAGLLLLMLWV